MSTPDRDRPRRVFSRKATTCCSPLRGVTARYAVPNLVHDTDQFLRQPPAAAHIAQRQAGVEGQLHCRVMRNEGIDVAAKDILTLLLGDPLRREKTAFDLIGDDEEWDVAEA